jgi:hypothetical protein
MAEVEFNPNLIPTGKKMKKIPELELKQKKAVTFTEEELKDLRNTFDVFDSDKDGSVSKEDIQRVLQSNKINISEDKLQQIMDEVDTDKSGMIEFNEFEEMMRNTDNDKSGVSSGMFRDAANKEKLKVKKARLARYSTAPKPTADIVHVEVQQPKEKASHLWEGAHLFWKLKQNVDVNIYETAELYIVNSYHREKHTDMPNVVLSRSIVDKLPVMIEPVPVVSKHGHNNAASKPRKPMPPSSSKSSKEGSARPGATVVVPQSEGDESWDRATALSKFVISRLNLKSVGDPNVPPVLEFVLLSGDNEMENPVLERDATEICDMLPQIARQVYLDGHVAEFHRKTTIVQQETKEAAAETAKAKKIATAVALTQNVFKDLLSQTQSKSSTESKAMQKGRALFRKLGKKQINAFRAKVLEERLAGNM